MTQPLFQVFVDGARDPSGAGVRRLAAAIAERYGLPVEQLEARLLAGRFRVKSGIERAAAEEYVRDLERLGATCSLTDAAGQPVALAPTVPRPAPVSSVPPGRLSNPALGPATPPRPAPPAPAPAKPSPAPAPAKPSLASGLSAAYDAGASTPADLGALGSGELRLATLDGDDEAAPPAPTWSEPEPVITPPVAAPAPRAAARGPSVPPPSDGNMFAPPPAEEEPLDLALDVAPRSPPTPTAPPVPTAPPASPGPGRAAPRLSRGQPVVAAAGADAEAEASSPPRPPLLRRLLGDERARTVLGGLVAVVLGFVPAHIYGAVRESGTYGTIDADLRQAQSQVQTIDDWDRLEPVRASALARKERAQGDIATTAVLLWLLAGGGAAFVWFRLLDWPKLLAAR